MKTVFLLLTAAIISITGCANVQSVNRSGDDFARALESGNFSNTGAISMHDSDYLFTVILVKNLEWAQESLKIADYGLPHVSQFKTGEKVTPFLTFITFRGGKKNLTYSVKLQGPDGKFIVFPNLVISDTVVNESMSYPSKEFVTISFELQPDPGSGASPLEPQPSLNGDSSPFDEFALGTYQFHIIIKDGGNIRSACVMQFELTE